MKLIAMVVLVLMGACVGGDEDESGSPHAEAQCSDRWTAFTEPGVTRCEQACADELEVQTDDDGLDAFEGGRRCYVDAQSKFFPPGRTAGESWCPSDLARDWNGAVGCCVADASPVVKFVECKP